MNGSVSGMRATVDGDLPFVHGFEQRRLRLGSGAVDLVRQKEIGEDGSGLELELLRVRVVDGDADDVARQHVAGELKPVKAAIDGACQRLRERRLSDSRHILDEQMAAGKQADQRQPDSLRFPAKNLIERVFERSESRRGQNRGSC